MKKTFIGIICALIGGVVGFFIGKGGCCSQNCEAGDQPAAGESPVAVVADGPNIDIAALPVDEEGFIVLFNGENLDGWRGYGMDVPPTSWEVSVAQARLRWKAAATSSSPINSRTSSCN